jgi:hypothetical protein
LKWLGLRRTASLIAAYQSQFAPEAISVSRKQSVLSTAQQGEIASQVDWDTFNRLIATTQGPKLSQLRRERKRKKQKGTRHKPLATPQKLPAS